jgi:hypothetical protein
MLPWHFQYVLITLDIFTSIPSAPSERMHNGSSKAKHYEAGGLEKGTLCMVLFIYL